MENTLIMFDCFGVILTETAEKFFKKRFSLEEALMIKNKYFVNADEGKVSLEKIASEIEKEYGYKKEDVISEFQENAKPILGTIELIKRLKKNYHIILVSNVTLGFLEPLFAKYDLDCLFEHEVKSCYLGIAKPDIGIYKHALSLYDNKFDKMYMIDDNQKNLDCLPELGVKGILFKDPDSLENTLKEEGLIF